MGGRIEMPRLDRTRARDLVGVSAVPLVGRALHAGDEIEPLLAGAPGGPFAPTTLLDFASAGQPLRATRFWTK